MPWTEKSIRDARAKKMARILKSGEWSRARCLTLADEWGVHEQTVYALRKKVLTGWQEKFEAEDPDVERAAFLEELRGMRQRLEKKGEAGPLVQVYKLEAQIRGLDRPSEHIHRHVGADGGEINLAVTVEALVAQMPSMTHEQLAALAGGGQHVIEGGHDGESARVDGPRVDGDPAETSGEIAGQDP